MVGNEACIGSTVGYWVSRGSSGALPDRDTKPPLRAGGTLTLPGWFPVTNQLAGGENSALKRDVMCDIPEAMASPGSDVIVLQVSHGKPLAFVETMVFFITEFPLKARAS